MLFPIPKPGTLIPIPVKGSEGVEGITTNIFCSCTTSKRVAVKCLHRLSPKRFTWVFVDIIVKEGWLTKSIHKRPLPIQIEVFKASYPNIVKE